MCCGPSCLNAPQLDFHRLGDHASVGPHGCKIGLIRPGRGHHVHHLAHTVDVGHLDITVLIGVGVVGIVDQTVPGRLIDNLRRLRYGQCRRLLVVANAAMQVSDFIGFPEAKIPLAQATIYVACAPKSNASYLAIEKAIQDITENRTQEVPDHLKDANYPGAKQLGHGEGYKYAHSYKNHHVKQDYMRKKKTYYMPTNMGQEKRIKEWLDMLRRKGA